MVHIARGVASAALTLQSIRLQALLGKDVLTPAEVRPRTTVHCRCRGEAGHQGVIAELQQDMLMAVENVPDGGDETELAWYLVHRAELFTRSADRLRRKAYEHALARRRL